MKISNITGREVIKVLNKLGYKFQRQNRGNHRIFTHPFLPMIVVPVYKKKAVKPGLLNGIIKQIGIAKEEFFRILKEK
jgi:predicted RNA binding protein YcfA (HicA-like mRNA interferase family)